MIKRVVFDFDGVIANSLPAAKKFYFEVREVLNLPKLSEKEMEHLRDTTFEYFLKELKISKFKLLSLFLLWRYKSKTHWTTVIPFLGMKKMLHSLQKKGYALDIVTANSKQNVEQFLAVNDLDMFDSIYSVHVLTSPFRRKAEILSSIVKKHQLQKSEILFVGDQTLDVAESHRAGVPVIAVTWGYNTRRVLAAQHPDFLAEKPGDVVKIVKTPRSPAPHQCTAPKYRE